MPRQVVIEEDQIPKKVVIEEDQIPKKVVIEEEEQTPMPKKLIEEDQIPILWNKDLQLWTVADTNVVFSPELCMVIGFIYRSILIRANSKDVQQVCNSYKVIYLDWEKYLF